MRRKALLCFLALVIAISIAPKPSIGQTRSISDLLPGVWTFTSVIAESDNGGKTEPFGKEPRGMIVFTKDGHFSLFQSRAEVPKIVANDRSKATPEEAASIVAAAIAYYGTYVINEAEKTLILTLTGSTYANLLATPVQKRIVTLLNDTELHFTNPRTPAGVTLLTTWARAKAP